MQSKSKSNSNDATFASMPWRVLSFFILVLIIAKGTKSMEQRRFPCFEPPNQAAWGWCGEVLSRRLAESQSTFGALKPKRDWYLFCWRAITCIFTYFQYSALKSWQKVHEFDIYEVRLKQKLHPTPPGRNIQPPCGAFPSYWAKGWDGMPKDLFQKITPPKVFGSPGTNSNHLGGSWEELGFSWDIRVLGNMTQVTEVNHMKLIRATELDVFRELQLPSAAIISVFWGCPAVATQVGSGRWLPKFGGSAGDPCWIS